MRGVYTISIDIAGITEDKTLILLTSPSTAVLEILSAQVSNLNNETNEQWDIGLFHVTTIGSPTGTSITPEKHERLDAAASATGLGDLDGEPSAYNSAAIDKQGVASLGGYRYDPTPEERPIVGPSRAIGLRLLTSPAETDISASIIFREIG